MKLKAVGKVMDEVFKTNAPITLSVFNTDHNLSLLVKSASHLRSAAQSSPPVSTEKQKTSQSV